MLGRKLQFPGHRKTASTALTLLLAVFLLLGGGVLAAHAQGADQFGLGYGTYTGLTQVDIRVTIARIVRTALGVLGIVAILIVLYAGFRIMTAAGNEEQVAEGKKILTAGVIGLVIIVSAFAIAQYILGVLTNQEQGQGAGITTEDPFACIGLSASCPSGALGSGIIESHYPARNATDVPRNTQIFITFKERMLPGSLTIGGATSTIAILKSNAIVGTSNQFPVKYAQSLTSNDIQIVDAGDHKTFGLIQRNCSGVTPDQCIGSASEKLFYSVALRGGADGIKKADGSAAFTGTFSSGYIWEFQVSTVLDLTPPKIDSVIPFPDSKDNPRNSLVQINFNEAVSPLGISTITLTKTGGSRIAGENNIGNAYRTVEFRTDDACGVNSCGETIYCLPGDTHITVTNRACGLSANPPTGVFPPTGITDMAGNSLDGNGDGAAQGPPTDDYVYSFDTNNTIDLTPPKVVAQEPDLVQGSIPGDIPRDLTIAATFSKLMSSTSFRSDTVQLVPGPNGAPPNYYLTSENVSTSQGALPSETRGKVNHDLFAKDQQYSAAFTSGLRDLHQNCFLPGGGQSVCTGSEKYCCNGIPTNDPAQYSALCGVPR